MTCPLISCIMPTMPSREPFVDRAISCFTAQTYQNRELVIVGEPTQRDIGGTCIRWACMKAPNVSIGAKRNYACQLARGTYIAHWDDDDWSAPERLSNQLMLAETNGLAVVGYNDMVFVDSRSWEIWMFDTLSKSSVVGSSLFYRRDWWEKHQFAAKRCGEDEDFAHRAYAERQLCSVSGLGLMVASSHDGNTSSRHYGGDHWSHVDAKYLPAGFAMA